MYLTLSQPSIDYADAISHELWMLSRPRGISVNETSQYFCGRYVHPISGDVCIGPIEQPQNVHADADELAFATLISAAVTEAEEQAIVDAINAAKGGTIQILDVISASPSLSPNLRTREQLDAAGWFPTEEI
jgi:hypothetical protein